MFSSVNVLFIKLTPSKDIMLILYNIYVKRKDYL
jgi:hypothetical protein